MAGVTVGAPERVLGDRLGLVTVGQQNVSEYRPCLVFEALAKFTDRGQAGNESGGRGGDGTVIIA